MTATAAAAVALSAQQAVADPLPDPTKKGVQAQVDRLHEEATQATEKYNGAKERADALRRQVGILQDGVARKQAELNGLRDRIGLLAAGQYWAGGLDPALQLFLSSDPDAYLDRATALDRAGERQTAALRRFLDEQRTLRQQRGEAQDRLRDLGAVQRELGGRKSRGVERVREG